MTGMFLYSVAKLPGESQDDMLAIKQHLGDALANWGYRIEDMEFVDGRSHSEQQRDMFILLGIGPVDDADRDVDLLDALESIVEDAPRIQVYGALLPLSMHSSSAAYHSAFDRRAGVELARARNPTKYLMDLAMACLENVRGPMS